MERSRRKRRRSAAWGRIRKRKAKNIIKKQNDEHVEKIKSKYIHEKINKKTNSGSYI